MRATLVQSAAKSRKATLCIIPQLHLQQAVQQIRLFRDKSFVRWPPHINLLFPFLPVEDAEPAVLEETAATAAQALAHVQPFKVQLSSLSYFEHASSYTMWLGPADNSGLVTLQAALQAAFPDCSDLSDDPSRGITSFTPHLSLGQWPKDKQLLERSMQEYSADAELMGLQFEVNEVCICSRQGYRDPFSVRYAVPLGSATPAASYRQPQLVDVPYTATATRNLGALLGLSADSPATDKRRFGLGAAAAPNGVWNFAFGANMSPRKLGGSRGLHPQESVPGVLRGWRLAFNHRGGFGNIVPAATEGGADAAADAAGGEAAAAAGPGDVHGVLHRLTPGELADLTCMENEYCPTTVMVQPYDPQQQQPGQQQQQELVPAIAFVTPPERLIKDGLPPTSRYLTLLQEGAQHWKLDAAYTQWLQQQPAVADGRDRGPEYYNSPAGEPLPAWPKIRTGGSQQQQQQNNRKGRGRGRGRGSGGGRGGGGGRGAGGRL